MHVEIKVQRKNTYDSDIVTCFYFLYKRGIGANH